MLHVPWSSNTLFAPKPYSVALFDVPLLCVRRNNEPSFPALHLDARSYHFTAPCHIPSSLFPAKESETILWFFIQSHSLTLITHFPCLFHSCCVWSVGTEPSIQDVGKAWMSKVLKSVSSFVSPLLFCITLLIAPNGKSAFLKINTKHWGDAFKAQRYNHIFFPKWWHSVPCSSPSMQCCDFHPTSLTSTLNFISHSIAQGHAMKRHFFGSLQSALAFLILNKLAFTSKLAILLLTLVF